MSGFTRLRLETLEAVTTPYDDVPPLWHPLRHLLGVRAFGINAWTAPAAGDWVIEPHDEADESGGGHEEVYVVLRGCAAITVGEQTFDAPGGSVVHISDPRLHREGRATEAHTTVLAIGGEPGAFEPSEWEGRWLREAGVTPAL